MKICDENAEEEKNDDDQCVYEIYLRKNEIENEVIMKRRRYEEWRRETEKKEIWNEEMKKIMKAWRNRENEKIMKLMKRKCVKIDDNMKMAEEMKKLWIIEKEIWNEVWWREKDEMK